MFHLKHAIEEAGLQIDDSLDLEEKVLLANYLYCGRIVARYLFLYGKASSWYAAATDPELEQQIEQLYFYQRNDLSWNLYLVVVMDPDEFSNISLYEKLEFLRDTEFTRKLVIPSDRFSDMIPAGHIIKQHPEEDPLLPIQEWRSVLADAGLSATWLDKPSDPLLNQFLETGNDKIEKKSVSTLLDVQNHSLRKIQTVTIPQEFRPHCYDSDITIKFPTVSLFYGPNGAGKTSILEAIELAMTGEIRKSSSHSAAMSRPIHLTVETESGTVSVSSDFNLTERKKREYEWYASRSDAWERSQLPQLFHTYNQFSVEDVYLYGLDNEQPEYSKRFSQMLFGNEAIHDQEHWQEYLNNVERKWREYGQQIQDLTAELERLDSQTTTQFATLTSYLVHSDFQFKIDDIKLSEKVRDAVGVIRPYYDKVSWSGDVLPPWQISAFRQQKQSELDCLLRVLATQQKDHETRVQELAEARNCADDASEIIQQVQQIRDQLSTLPISTELLQFLTQDPDFLSKYSQAYIQFTNAQQQRYQYSTFSVTFHDLKECTETEEQLCQAAEEYPTLCTQRDRFKQKLAEQDQLIEHKQKEKDTFQNTMSVIQSVGWRFLELQQVVEHCPLCGSSVDRAQIIQHLSTVSKFQSDELSNLLYDRQSMQAEYSWIEKRVTAAEKRTHLLSRFQDAWKVIRPTSLASLLPKQESASPVVLVRQVFDLKSQIERQASLTQSALSQLWELLGSSRQIGTMETFLSNVEAVCQATKQALQAVGVQVSNHRPSTLYYALLLFQEENDERFRRAYQESNLTKSKIERLTQDISRSQAEMQRLTQQIGVLKSALHQADLLQELWDHASPYLKPEVCARGDLDWGKQLDKLQQLALDCLEADHLEEERQRIQERISNLQKKQERAFYLRNILQKLQPLESYAKKFIEAHLNQISSIFLQLHTPQEYVRLELQTVNQREELIAVRNSASRDIVRLQEMSTGQQTAVVLAVLLEMHLSMQNVPHFLLIDEPVANIDDLNILSMLDFFREMVISQHRQLFITTANQNVAKLFRRKFSFLKEEYTEFTIKRSKNMKVNISVKQYDQNGILQ